MLKYKFYRKLLWGKHKFNYDESRVMEIYFPAGEDRDKERRIVFRGDDGVVLYLLRRIEALEEKLIVKKK